MSSIRRCLNIVSVVISFPDNIVVLAKNSTFFNNPIYSYKVYCWKSDKLSWSFWGKGLDIKYKKNVTVSALSSVKKIIFFWQLVLLIKFIITNSSLFIRHKKYYKGKGIKKYLIALIDDFKLLALRPDILHFEFGTLGVKKIYLKDILQCKVIVSFRGYDLNYYKLDNANIYSDVWEKSDGFHFLGNDLYMRAIKRGFDSINKVVHFIPPAVYPEVFKREMPLIREKSVKPISIISVGRLVWKKGIEYGLLAFRKYLDMGGQGTYHIVGIGPAFEEIQYFVYELDLIEKVVLHGKLMPDQTKKCLDNADVFLHPSISEGFCNAVIEAQAMEIPVVTTDADGLSENIADGVTGFLVKKWDTEGMASKLFELYNNPELRYKLGSNGRERVLNKFTVEKQAIAFDKMYKEVYGL